MRTTCAHCGQPIKKFIIGWTHVNEGFPLIPTTLHVATPRRK